MKITKIHYAKKKGNVCCLKDGKRLSEYMAWRSMKHRCLNKKNPYYKHYGGRGIKVCKRWLNSFQNFISDMGFKPSPKHTLDRKKNNLNYTPGNCRWATMKEQCRNRRNNTWLEHDGKRMTKQAWADYLGVHKSNLLKNKKKTFSEIVEHYKKNGKRRVIKIAHNGKIQGTAEWAKELGLERRKLSYLLERNPFSEIYKKHKK